MTQKIAVVFPGQGSQYLGMASEFLAVNSEARILLEQAEELCRLPLRRLCQEGPLEELTRSLNLQPALTAVNLLCWQALTQALPALRPHCFAGHSLGEFSALAAAGVLDTAAVLRLVLRRGELMEREAELHPGGMRAVLGLEIDTVRQALETVADRGVVVVANHNTARQIVLSGDAAGLDGAAEVLKGLGGKIIPLKVALANHSPLVAGAVPDFVAALARERFRQAKAPVYCNVSANAEFAPEVIRDLLGRQLASPVRWYESVCAMLADGVEIFVEVGAKNVLSGIIRKIVPESVLCLNVENPAGIEALASVLAV